METISIVVPVYNAAAYIRETVNMVLQQTWQNWELILVEDCSTDNSKETLLELQKDLQDERIHVICKEKNEGAASARNTGIDAMQGRYLAFLDADDIWMPDKLSKELAFMKQKEAAFVFTAYEFGDEHAKGTGKFVHVPESLTYRQALSRTVIFTTTVLIDTEKTGKEIIRMPLVASEDSATWWQILKAGYTAFGLNEVLAVYRRPAASLSSNKLTAMKRIWYLYRNVEQLSFLYSCYCFIGWAVRATCRRL